MSSSSAIIVRHKKRIDRLFLRFSAMYGHTWRSIYKTDEFLNYTKKIWADGLMSFDDKSFEYALQSCLKSGPFPPTLPHFIEYCRAYHKPNTFFQSEKASHKACPSVANKHLLQMKKILHINP